MFPIPEKPGDKSCSKCGAIVHPDWHFVPDTEKPD